LAENDPQDDRPRTRIQRRNSEAILAAALEVFAAHGFRGATLDQIAEVAGLSKPNLLYYFPSKEAIHLELLGGLLDTWLAPLRAVDPGGDPVGEILTYVRRKLDMSRRMPRESRLFANEVLQGAPRIGAALTGTLKALVDDKAAVIAGWAAAGRIAPVDPHHLIFSIWALTQHYADFDVQVRAVLGDGHDPFPEAEAFLTGLYTRLLSPAPHGQAKPGGGDAGLTIGRESPPALTQA
jgi:TetR/AcrR family transcriptional regulator